MAIASKSPAAWRDAALVDAQIEAPTRLLGRPELLGHRAGELHQVDRAARQRRRDSARDSCSSFSARWPKVAAHRARPRRRRAQVVLERGLQAQPRRRERRAQLVRGVGGQRAFDVERLRQPLQQAVDVVAHRAQLARHARQARSAAGRRRCAARSPTSSSCSTRSSRRAMRRSSSASSGSTAHQRNDEAEQGAVERRAPLVQRIGEAAGRAGRASDAARCRCATARRSAKPVASGTPNACAGACGGAHAARARRRRRAGRSPASLSMIGCAARSAAACVVERAALVAQVEVVHGDVDHAVRALDHLVVEVVVDLAVDVPRHAEHARQPDAADPERSACASAGRRDVRECVSRARISVVSSAKASR